MAIRTKKYFYKGTKNEARAVKITEKNLSDVVAYICRNGGAATGHVGDTKSGRPARIRIKQRTNGRTWSKLDWRVAKLGDYILRQEFVAGAFYKEARTEFSRLSSEAFEELFVPVS